MRVATVGIALAAAGLLVAHGLEAQTSRSHLGARISYQFDAEEFGIGAQLGVPIARRLEFYPSFDYYFVDPGNFWAMNADLKYRISATSSMDWLYVGAGLNVTGFSVGPVDDTDLGANLLAGVEPLRGRIHPFAEARLILGDGSAFQLSAGLNLTLGRH
jgi:hypothetical protein